MAQSRPSLSFFKDRAVGQRLMVDKFQVLVRKVEPAAHAAAVKASIPSHFPKILKDLVPCLS